MKKLFITGSSRGIGRSVTQYALDRGWSVHGFSRKGGPEHENYQHQSVDLGAPGEAEDIYFDADERTEAVVLFNNAAALGPVKHLHQMDAKVFDSVVRLNLTAPLVLSSNFIQTFAGRNIPRLIVNVGTGASTNPYDGWALYCATKAGLDMLTRVLDKELALLPKQEEAFSIRTIAPGVVATNMQETIREADQGGFSNKQKFIRLHEEGELSDPALVGQTYVELFEKILNEPSDWPELITRIPQNPGG